MGMGIARETLEVAFTGEVATGVSLFLPENPAAWILCLPALGVPAAYYQPLALALAARGLAVATVDHRGNGASTVRPGRRVDFGYADLVSDAGTVLAALRQRLSLPVAALGHSLGGQVAALLAGRSPGSLDALLLTACGTPYWRGFPVRTGLMVLGVAQLARVSGPLLGHFPGEHLGFGGREAARLMREWSSFARTGRLHVQGLDAEALFAGVRAPTLMVSIAGDWMATRASVDHLGGKLSAAPLERVHLARGSIDSRALDHFRWARTPDGVADVLTAWLDRRLGLARTALAGA